MEKERITGHDVLALPIGDLVLVRITEFMPLMRDSVLPDDDVLEGLDHILRLRVVHAIARLTYDELKSELDGFHRLVPHSVREELNKRSTPWATRFESYAKILEAAVGMGDKKDWLEVFKNPIWEARKASLKRRGLM